MNFNFFFSTPKSQKSNVWCLKVRSFSQNLQRPIPRLYVKCPISILQNSWRLEILSKLPLFELDSKAALACFYSFISKLAEKCNFRIDLESYEFQIHFLCFLSSHSPSISWVMLRLQRHIIMWSTPTLPQTPHCSTSSSEWQWAALWWTANKLLFYLTLHT